MHAAVMAIRLLGSIFKRVHHGCCVYEGGSRDSSAISGGSRTGTPLQPWREQGGQLLGCGGVGSASRVHVIEAFV